MSTIGIKTYLESDLAREVTRVARAQGRSESSLIAEALRARFAAASDGAALASETTQKRALARVDVRIDKIQRDQALIKECLLVFVRVWLEHNPPIEDEHAESIAASAEARFERFLDLVAQGLEPGRSMLSGQAGVAHAGKEQALPAEAGA